VFLIFLTTIYIFYVVFESFSGLARFGGYKVGAISVGVSLQNQILSLNRLLGFLIAPMVGFFVDTGGSSEDIYIIGLSGSLLGGVSLLVVYINWQCLINFFASLSESFVKNGYSIRSLLSRSNGILSAYKHKPVKLKYNYFFAQAFTTGLAMPSVFLLNIVAVKTPEYSSTILQMTTAISGFGNLILNFYTIPLVSVEESSNKTLSVEDSHKSIFLGKVFGMLFLSPALFLLCFALL